MAENLPKLLTIIKGLEHQMPPEPEPTSFIPFINREKEWKRIVEYPDGSYYLFGGPAGYGKTALLRKIQEEFRHRNWLCAYVSISEEYATLPQLILEIGKQMQIEVPVNINDENPPGKIGELLGKALTRQEEVHHYLGIALLLDVDHEPWPALIDLLKVMVEELIPGLYDGLAASDYFLKTQKTERSFRVILSGRYLASHIQKFDYTYSRYDITQLTPFDYTVALDICRQNITQSDEQEAFAPHLLFYSGGHPRCMVHILEAFQESRMLTTPFLRSEQYRTQIKQISFEEAAWVRANIPNHVRTIFDILCLYRRLDIPLFNELLQKGVIWHGAAEDGYELRSKLLETYLINWTDESRRYVSDSIVRRMLTIWLYRNLSADEFTFRCEQAKSFYLQRLQHATESRPYWAIEVLFEFLQSNIFLIEDQSSRSQLSQTFFEEKLPSVLDPLFENCDDPRTERDSLVGVLEQDWEFCFTLNYYLRDLVYNDAPYRAMLQAIENDVTRRRNQHPSEKKHEQSEQEVPTSIPTTREQQQYSYFLSYAWENVGEADHIESLLARNHRRVLRDEGQIEAGGEISDAVEKMIQQADTFIALWSEAYAQSTWCPNELEYARNRQAKGQKPERIVLITLDETEVRLRFTTTLHLCGIDRRDRELSIQRLLQEEPEK